jgi:preprotein translocase subunit SecG
MLNLLNALRYFVFGVFVICNAIITSVSVWNLSIAENIALDAITKQIDTYLIFVGASGLLLMFTIIFFELYGKNIFLVQVWFELLWVGLFCVMELVGAVIITSQTNSQTCNPNSRGNSRALAPSPSQSPCASTQVLQAFTWVCAVLLLGYLIFLSILSFAKYKDDPTIWQAIVRKYPVANGQSLKSAPASPTVAHFRSQTPVIAAPRPRRLDTFRNAILSYRSGLSLDYEVEPYQPPQLMHSPPATNDIVTPVPVTNSSPHLFRSVDESNQSRQLPLSSPFYHSSIQTALVENQSKVHPVVISERPPQMRQLAPSPPLLGDWPRPDATSRPRTKRKPLPLPQRPIESGQQVELPRPPPPLHQPVISSPYTFDAPALVAALQPLAHQSSSRRSKPSGPRLQFNSANDGQSGFPNIR